MISTGLTDKLKKKKERKKKSPGFSKNEMSVSFLFPKILSISSTVDRFHLIL
jgi:hypothetical protein